MSKDKSIKGLNCLGVELSCYRWEYRNQYVRILREVLTAMAESVHDQNNFETEEEDDCVIFKGSPLYASLLQSGSLAEELEIEQTGIATPLRNHKKENFKENSSEEKSNVRVAFLNRRWKLLFEQLKSWFLPDLSSVYFKYYEDVVQNLSASSCLDEDDRDFLHFYIQSSCTASESSKRSNKISRLALYTIPCLISFSAYQFFNWDVARQQLPWNSLFLATIIPVIILETLQEARVYKHRKKCKKVLYLYEDFIRKNEKMTSMVKKCLRLVQETELISRGFTLVSQRNPLSRIEGSQKDTVTRQCPVLRKLVFTFCREAVQFFREKTKSLFDICPLSKELDIQGSYLAYEPIQSYGPCLQTDIEDAETLYTITDGYSISALKGIAHLLSLHQSEFIKALILVQQERGDKGKMSSKICVDELSVVESISAMLMEWTAALQKSHDYHSCAWMNREPVTKTSRTQSNVEDIYVAVHSLDLHLQAALARVKCLSDHIQRLPDTGEKDFNLDDLLDKMQPIRAELESCKGCWEEGVNRIEKISGKNSTRVEDSSPGNSQAGEETLSADKLEKTVEDYIIEDQVFEGYTDPDEVSADYEWEKPLTAEEKEKKRKEKEEALRMLSELKSVISVRAVETERREKAAMLKMYPDLTVSEKLRNTVTSQEVLRRPCPSITSDQDTAVSFCEHTASKPCKKPAEDFISKNCDEIGKIYVDFDDSCADRTANICSRIHNENDFANLNDELNESIADEVKHKVDTKCEVHLPDELLNERDKHSVSSVFGVRRLRKGDMLELSDSDLEEYREDESNDEYKSDEDERPKLGLPLLKLSGAADSYVAEGSASDGMQQFRLPVLKLGERLEHFSGANLGFTSELATEAVAKSKIMGVMEETTFGGDVYGECSSSSDEDGKDDGDDKNN